MVSTEPAAVQTVHGARLSLQAASAVRSPSPVHGASRWLTDRAAVPHSRSHPVQARPPARFVVKSAKQVVGSSAGGLTVQSSRTRFAGRLISSVRPLGQVQCRARPCSWYVLAQACRSKRQAQSGHPRPFTAQAAGSRTGLPFLTPDRTRRKRVFRQDLS